MHKRSLTKARSSSPETVPKILSEDVFISVWIDRSPCLARRCWVVSLDGDDDKTLGRFPQTEKPETQTKAMSSAIEVGRERRLRVYFYEIDSRNLLYDPIVSKKGIYRLPRLNRNASSIAG